MGKKDTLVVLEEVTNDAIKEASHRNVVFPRDYSQIFTRCAKERQISDDFSDEAFLERIAQQTLDKANSMIDNTQAQIYELRDCAEDVYSAIVSQDKEKISTVTQTIINLQKEIASLKEEVHKDFLTGLYNRKWIYDEVLDTNTNFPSDGLLCFVDVDKFKAINDNFGHTVGDRVIVYLSHALNAFFISEELPIYIIRYAGDEFLIFCFDSAFPLQEIVEKLQLSFYSKKFKAQEEIFAINFSFGVCSFEKGSAFIDAFRQADEAMYKNKQRDSKDQ